MPLMVKESKGGTLTSNVTDTQIPGLTIKALELRKKQPSYVRLSYDRLPPVYSSQKRERGRRDRVENKKKEGTNKRNIKGKESNLTEQKFNDA